MKSQVNDLHELHFISFFTFTSLFLRSLVFTLKSTLNQKKKIEIDTRPIKIRAMEKSQPVPKILN